MAEEPTEEVDVLEYREGRIKVLAQPLRHIGDARADPAPPLGISHVFPEDDHLSLLNFSGAGDEGQEARFANAIGSDQSDHPPSRYLEAHTVESAFTAVGQREIPDDCDRGPLFRIGGAAFPHGCSVSSSQSGQAASGSRRT